MAAEQIAMQAAQGGTGIAQEIGGNLINRMWGKKDRKNQLEQQEKLTGIQEASNLRMMEAAHQQQQEMFGITHGAQLQGQKELFDYTYKSQADKMKELEEAGLNPALMYAQGIQGGGGSTTPTSGQTGAGAAGSAGAGHASDEASMRAVRAQEMGIRLQQRMQIAQIENLRAETENKRAQTEATKENTITTKESRDILIENLKQEGIGNWLNNIEQKYKHGGNMPNTIEMFRNEVYDISTGLQEKSLFNQEAITAILKTMAETGNELAQEALNNKKAQGYMTELLNGIKNANANETKAAAIKLATEHSTGEFTNWRTWVDLGVDAVNTVVNAATGISGAKTAAKAIGNAGKIRTTTTNTTHGKGYSSTVSRTGLE